jgi:hypothetical protein
MTLKGNKPIVREAVMMKEYADKTQWTRARVEERVCDVIRFAAKLSPRDPNKLKLIKSLPASCSVRSEWLESVIAELDTDFRPQLRVPQNLYGELYDFITDWLDSVDSNLDRKIIIMHACLMSFNQIGVKIGISRQRGSRRFAKSLDALVWYLNHSEKYKIKPTGK